MLRMICFVMLLTLCAGRPLNACLWDRDTPQEEGDNRPDVVAALTGRFERNPPLYYQMRLDRVATHLQDHPDHLDSYDDAGVACDRLGRGEVAISWMERKLSQIQDQDPSDPRHLYRYHANVGTFIMHEWLRGGADRSQIERVRAAREHIALAIEINPDAHFGREAYQLLAMDWIINPPTESWHDLPNLLGWSFGDIHGERTEPSEAEEAVHALAGLVILGNAWESVDVFHALNVALQRDSVGFERSRDGGRNTLAYFAWLRCCELIDDGKSSLYPGAPTGNDLKSVLPAPDFPSQNSLLENAFSDLRADAESWHVNRMAFMNGRLRAGRHPDTDSRFWEGYDEAPIPKLPSISLHEAYHANVNRRMRDFIVGCALIASLFVVGIVTVVYRTRRTMASSALGHNFPPT